MAAIGHKRGQRSASHIGSSARTVREPQQVESPSE